MLDLYILDGRIIKRCNTLTEWALWMETADRRVALDAIGDIVISTVFLGVDHNFYGDGDPLLFETLVFMPGGEQNEMFRYFTWEEAQAGHQEMLEAVRQQTTLADFCLMELLGKISTIKERQP